MDSQHLICVGEPEARKNSGYTIILQRTHILEMLLRSQRESQLIVTGRVLPTSAGSLVDAGG